MSTKILRTPVQVPKRVLQAKEREKNMVSKKQRSSKHLIMLYSKTTFPSNWSRVNMWNQVSKTFRSMEANLSQCKGKFILHLTKFIDGVIFWGKIQHLKLLSLSGSRITGMWAISGGLSRQINSMIRKQTTWCENHLNQMKLNQSIRLNWRRLQVIWNKSLHKILKTKLHLICHTTWAQAKV